MQLECSTTTFPIADLLELCVRIMITGAVEVEAPDGTYRVFVRGGRIYHAESPREAGLDALWPLFDQPAARWRFHAGLSSRHRTINERPASLLTRAQRLAAEWRAIRPSLASLDVVPQLVVPDNMEMVRVDEEHWAVLCLADGVRTIREIAGEAGIEPVDACRMLVRLHKRGLVKLDQERRREPRPALRMGQPHAESGGEQADAASFFARLLASLPVEPVDNAGAPADERAAKVDQIMSILGSA